MESVIERASGQALADLLRRARARGREVSPGWGMMVVPRSCWVRWVGQAPARVVCGSSPRPEACVPRTVTALVGSDAVPGAELKWIGSAPPVMASCSHSVGVGVGHLVPLADGNSYDSRRHHVFHGEVDDPATHLRGFRQSVIGVDAKSLAVS